MSSWLNLNLPGLVQRLRTFQNNRCFSRGTSLAAPFVFLCLVTPLCYFPPLFTPPGGTMHLVLVVVIIQLCSYFYRCLIRCTGKKMKSEGCIFLNIYSKNKFSSIQSKLLSSTAAWCQYPLIQQWPEILGPRR